jgi:hypothetical protein
VTEHADQLREAFETYENQTPDAAAVYARVQELSTKYKRRRRSLQVAGGTVLAAVAVAGVVTLPNLLPGNARNTSTVTFPAGAVPSSAAPSTIPSMSPTDLNRYWAAYFQAGYDYDDAVKLADLWHVKAPIGKVKAEAGRRLLAGETLPVKPTPSGIASALESKRLDAFFKKGYDYEDAAKLAKTWHLKSAYEAKVEGGKRILAGQTLPIQP